VGYAAGNNLGIEHLPESCDCYFIVNPDTTLPEEEAIIEMAEKLTSKSELGILAPAVGDEETLNQHGDTAPVRLLHHFNLLPAVKSRDDGLISRTQVVGCAMMVSAPMVDHIGGIDPEFFLYVEEIEFCYRARKNGYEVAYDPDIVVHHEDETEGYSHPEPYQTYYRARNIFTLARRQFSGLGKFIILSSIGVLLYAIVINREWGLLRPWLFGVFDGFTGKEGRTRYLTP
jgi:GT2 family glycosyltransferase